MKARRVLACSLSLFLLLPCASAVGSNGGPKPYEFPQMSGWTLSEDVQVFSPETLFEYIDGAADLYLTYRFLELKVAEYVNEKKASIAIEVYRHGSPTDAFGIYSQERLSNSDFVDIGAQGYSEGDVLNFFAGSYYVKMTGYQLGPEDRTVLRGLGKKVADNLGEKGFLPAILSAFPEEGKIKNSERYVAVKFLGHGFLHSGYTADYEVAPEKFKLFIVEGGDRADCEVMVRKYLETAGDRKSEIREGRYVFKDPYQGEIGLGWRGIYLWGIVNAGDVTIRVKYMDALEGTMRKIKN
jgi:hypothetical protein